MGSLDIANAKHEGDRSLRETANDVLFSALVMAGHFKNRMMNPFRREGEPMPWRQRVAALVGRTVINPVDVVVGDRHPGALAGNWLTARGKAASIGNQLLASVGAIADAESGRRLVVSVHDEAQTAVTTDPEPFLDVPMGAYSDSGDLGMLADLRKGGSVTGAKNE